MKILILTANIGGFDTQKEFPAQLVEDGQTYEYFCFTESNLLRPMTALDNRMKAKYFKLQAHKLFPDFDYYIWIDSAFQIKSEMFLQIMVHHIWLGDADIAVTKHPQRNCIYDEAEFVLHGIISGNKYLASRYGKSKIEFERNYYQSLLYPKDNGLYACGLFIVRNDKKMNSFMDAWWQKCLEWSCFDQLSFPFLAKQHDVNIMPLVFDNYLDNQFYKIVKHTQVK